MRILDPAEGGPPAPILQQWPDHSPARMARDFLLWRHLRVIRARTMRRVHQAAEELRSALVPGAVRSNATLKSASIGRP